MEVFYALFFQLLYSTDVLKLTNINFIPGSISLAIIGDQLIKFDPIFSLMLTPHSLPSGSNFSMTAGNFQEIYSECNTWDCIATYFFRDTAHNVIDYIDTIWRILKPGGMLINLGPLLYHFENLANELSIELSYEDIKNVVLQYGFQLEVEEETVLSTYTVNDLSMMKYCYEFVLFVVRKPQ